MRSAFIPPSVREFDTLFLERGGGLDDIKVFVPPSVSRGRRGGGIFNVLSGLAKKAIPFLMRNVAPEVTRMGKDVLGDMIQGRKFRDSLKTRGVTALKGVGQRLARGGGVKKRKKKKRVRITKTKRRSTTPCYKRDIFNMKALV